MKKITIESPEKYFEEMLDSLQNVVSSLKHVRHGNLDQLESGGYSELEIWVNSFRDVFNEDVKFLFTSIGLSYSSYDHPFEADHVARAISNLESILEELLNNRSLYISRIKNVTTYASEPEMKEWVDVYKKFKRNTELLVKEGTLIAGQNRPVH